MSNERGKPFKPGNPGRKRGAKNKATREVRELGQRILQSPEYLESVKARLLAGTAGSLEVLLWHYAYGKPDSQLAIQAHDEAVALFPFPELRVILTGGGSDRDSA